MVLSHFDCVRASKKPSRSILFRVTRFMTVYRASEELHGFAGALFPKMKRGLELNAS